MVRLLAVTLGQPGLRHLRSFVHRIGSGQRAAVLRWPVPVLLVLPRRTRQTPPRSLPSHFVLPDDFAGRRARRDLRGHPGAQSFSTAIYEFPLTLCLTALLAVIVALAGRLAGSRFLGIATLCMAAVLLYHAACLQERFHLRRFAIFTAAFAWAIASRLAQAALPHAVSRQDRTRRAVPESAKEPCWPRPTTPRTSGVGKALDHFSGAPKRVGVIGLGAGTLAAYGNAGDYFRFYEINPLVVSIARNWFSAISATRPPRSTSPWATRACRWPRNPQQFDVLAVDAFSGDAIPVHLLTKEAFALYLRHLKPDGILAIHTSNTYLDLNPVVQLLADDAHYPARLITNDDDLRKLIDASDWVLVTRNDRFLERPGRHDAPGAHRGAAATCGSGPTTTTICSKSCARCDSTKQVPTRARVPARDQCRCASYRRRAAVTNVSSFRKLPAILLQPAVRRTRRTLVLNRFMSI